MAWTLEEFQHAQKRVGTGEQALRWAFRFVEVNLDELLSTELSTAYLELMAFIYGPPKHPPANDEGTFALPDMRISSFQEYLRDLLCGVALGRPVRARPASRWLEVMGDRYGFRVDASDPLDDLYSTVEHLLLGLPPGRLLRICRAPRPREVRNCGRLFLSKRAAQQYCSVICQQRAHHQRNQHAHTALSA
jgi:hypothetical protein